MGIMEVGVPMGVIAAIDPIDKSNLHGNVQNINIIKGGQCHW